MTINGMTLRERWESWSENDRLLASIALPGLLVCLVLIVVCFWRVSTGDIQGVYKPLAAIQVLMLGVLGSFIVLKR